MRRDIQSTRELPLATLRWITEATGSGTMIQSVRLLAGATSSTLHSVEILRNGQRMQLVLRQFTNALFDREGRSSFQKVVLFEFPRPGVHALGLVTNEDPGKLVDAIGEECVLVYVPTAPNPLSGYMLVVPKRSVTSVDIPVEDALAMVVSSGSALPESLQSDGHPQLSRPRFQPFRRRKEEEE